MAGSAIRTSLFVLPPLRWLDSLGGLVLGAVAGVAIVWVDRGRCAPRSRSARAARGGAAVADPRRDQRARAAVAPARRDRAGRSVSGDPGARGERRSARSGAAGEPGRPLRPQQRLPDHRQRLRPRCLRLGLGGGAEPRRHQRPRRRRDEGSSGRPPRRRVPRRRRRRLQRPRRHRRASCCGARRETARTGRAGGGPGGRDPRLSRERTFRRRGRADRRDEHRAHRGRLRARPRQSQDHDAARRVRHGNSGGPAVDIRGRVRTTVFASRIGAESQGYGVPTEIVQSTLAEAREAGPVSTGPCVASARGRRESPAAA